MDKFELRKDSLCNRCGERFFYRDAKTETMEFDGDEFEFTRCPKCMRIWGSLFNITYQNIDNKIIDIKGDDLNGT